MCSDKLKAMKQSELDVTPLSFAKIVLEDLNEHISERCTWSSKQWSSLSPDLTPLDFYVRM